MKRVLGDCVRLPAWCCPITLSPSACNRVSQLHTSKLHTLSSSGSDARHARPSPTNQRTPEGRRQTKALRPRLKMGYTRSKESTKERANSIEQSYATPKPNGRSQMWRSFPCRSQAPINADEITSSNVCCPTASATTDRSIASIDWGWRTASAFSWACV